MREPYCTWLPRLPRPCCYERASSFPGQISKLGGQKISQAMHFPGKAWPSAIVAIAGEKVRWCHDFKKLINALKVFGLSRNRTVQLRNLQQTCWGCHISVHNHVAMTTSNIKWLWFVITVLTNLGLVSLYLFPDVLRPWCFRFSLNCESSWITDCCVMISPFSSLH